ncbi:MAG: CopG family transcriptional regulator [Bacteroidetes bacterium]|nr:CopG family transcriptional regulator [Bacteroidota bacterium]
MKKKTEEKKPVSVYLKKSTLDKLDRMTRIEVPSRSNLIERLLEEWIKTKK